MSRKNFYAELLVFITENAMTGQGSRVEEPNLSLLMRAVGGDSEAQAYLCKHYSLMVARLQENEFRASAVGLEPLCTDSWHST